MLNESEHRAKFENAFDFSDLIKDPSPEEFEKECMGQRMEQQLSDDDGNKGGGITDEDDVDGKVEQLGLPLQNHTNLREDEGL